MPQVQLLWPANAINQHPVVILLPGASSAENAACSFGSADDERGDNSQGVDGRVEEKKKWSSVKTMEGALGRCFMNRYRPAFARLESGLPQ